MIVPLALTLALAQTETRAESASLYAYMNSRIKMRGDPKEHKNANDLEWTHNWGKVRPYFVQRVKVGSRFLGVVGFSVAHMSQPSDMLTDLVWVEEGNIRFIRVIRDVIDYELTPFLPRLFWSKGQILLRQPHGYEILDLGANKVGFISVPDASCYVGRARTGEILTIMMIKDRFTLIWLDPKTRKVRTRVVREALPEYTYFKYYLVSNQVVNVDFNLNNITLKLRMDVTTGKILSRKFVDIYGKEVTGPAKRKPPFTGVTRGGGF
jgi:hypothetical protein